MNTFTFGRVDKLKVDVNGWQMDGNNVTVAGSTEYGSYADAVAIRNQLLGYGPGNDEDVVPLVWDERPENNGYYRVMSVSATEDPAEAPFGVIRWSLQLYRIHGFGAPLVEITQIGKQRVNTRDFESDIESAWVGTPAAVRSFTEFNPDVASYYNRLGVTRVAEGAKNVAVFEGIQKIKQFYVDPLNYYDGAATVKIGGKIVVSRRAANVPTDWEISNGIIKMWPVAGSNFRVNLAVWNSGTSSWSTAWQVDLQGGQAGAVDMQFPHTITILRNSPEEVAVRFSAVTSTSEKDPIPVDVTLKRGAYFFALHFTSTYTNKFGIQLVNFTDKWLGVKGGYSRAWYNAAATRTNLALNPSLTDDAVGWAAVAGVATGRLKLGPLEGQVDSSLLDRVKDDWFFRATANAAHAAASFGVRYGSSTSTTIAVTAGVTYRASVWLRCSVARSLMLQVKFYDAANAQVGATITGTPLTSTAATWEGGYTIPATVAPAGAVRAVVEAVGGGASAWANGQTLDMDLVLFEASSSAGSYFDGNSESNVGGVWHGWVGNVGSSTSVQYTPSGTDGGMFLAGPQELRLQSNILNPYESGVLQVAQWDAAIGYLPVNQQVTTDAEILRYMWAAAERMSVVAQ